jgi:chemotaxis protein methyltransferase WspC
MADLEEAQRLADEGRLKEAEALCEAHLRQHGHAAKAFFLLGLVRDNADDLEAAREYYRKALYLEPNHYEALMHLACLTDKAGDQAGALVLRNRARRLTERGGK